jgi:hypothetical protein
LLRLRPDIDDLRLKLCRDRRLLFSVDATTGQTGTNGKQQMANNKTK